MGAIVFSRIIAQKITTHSKIIYMKLTYLSISGCFLPDNFAFLNLRNRHFSVIFWVFSFRHFLYVTDRLRVRNKYILYRGIPKRLPGAPPWSNGSVLDHISLSSVFESRHGHIWRLFHLRLRFISFGGRSVHLAYRVHKSGRKTSVIIIITKRLRDPEQLNHCQHTLRHRFRIRSMKSHGLMFGSTYGHFSSSCCLYEGWTCTDGIYYKPSTAGNGLNSYTGFEEHVC